jgi:hypothetical protein
MAGFAGAVLDELECEREKLGARGHSRWDTKPPSYHSDGREVALKFKVGFLYGGVFFPSRLYSAQGFRPDVNALDEGKDRMTDLDENKEGDIMPARNKHNAVNAVQF